jgi:hypothetical protein
LQPNSQPITAARRIAGNTLILLPGVVLVGTSIVKFAHVPKVVSEFANMGFDGNKVILIAALEIISAALLMLRPVRAFGLLMVSAFLGGAIATHMQHGQSPAGPAILLAVVWLGVWLRHPEAMWSIQRFESRGEAQKYPEVVTRRA